MNTLIDTDLPILVTPTPEWDAKLNENRRTDEFLLERGAHHGARKLEQMKNGVKRDGKHDVLTCRHDLAQRYRSDELDAFIKGFLDSFREAYIVHAIYFEEITGPLTVKRDLTVMLMPRLRLA